MEQFTIKQAAEATGFDERQIMYKIRKEQIEAQKIGWIWVLPGSSVETLKEMKKAESKKSKKKN